MPVTLIIMDPSNYADATVTVYSDMDAAIEAFASVIDKVAFVAEVQDDGTIKIDRVSIERKSGGEV